MDAIAEWTAAQDRVCELVGGVPAEQAERAVPACPDWTVRQLLAHMVGLGVDVLAGDEPDDHNPAWTQRQVDARADAPVAELVAEWRGITAALQEWMAAQSTRPLGDVIIHEQDLRGALGVPGAHDTDGLRALRERMAGRLAQTLGDRPPVALVSADWTWCSAGDPADAAVVVRADAFDLARAVMARRSARQLRAWTVRGDIGPCLDAFATLGPLPDADLTE